MARVMHPSTLQSNFDMALHSCGWNEVYDARLVRVVSSKGSLNHRQWIMASNSALRKAKVAADSKGIKSQEQRYEFRVCVHKSCRRSGALQTLEVLRGLSPPNVVVESCGCLGHCGSGPNLVVLPAEIFVSHCNTASHVARLLELQCGALDYENNLKALALKQQGNAAFEHGNFSSAESFYSEGIKLGPSGGLHQLYGNRSAVRLANGDVKSSLEDALEAAQIAPKWAGAYLHQGEAYTAMGKYSDALSVYQKACLFDTSLRRSKSFLLKLQKLDAECSRLANLHFISSMP